MMNLVDDTILTSLDHQEGLDKQLAWAEQQFVATIREQQLLQHEIEAIQNDITEFESEYHAQIGGLLEELDALEHRLNPQAPATQSLVKENSHIPMIPGMGTDMTAEETKVADKEDNRRQDEAVKKESNRLYRKLAKKVHPDQAKEEPEADAAFSILKESHEKNDLSTMLLLERAIDSDSDDPISTKLAAMEQQREALIRQNDKLKMERHQLLHSDIYTLKIRTLNAKLEGKDLLKSIAMSIQIQIDEKKKLLQTARYQNS